MALLDNAAERWPDAAQGARLLGEWASDIRQEQVPLGLESGGLGPLEYGRRARLLGTGLADLSQVGWSDPQAPPRPAVLVAGTQPALGTAQLELLEQLGWLSLGGGTVDALARIEPVVIVMPPPMEERGPGHPVHAGHGQGTLGARAEDSNGRRGLLTAGHVAPFLQSRAYDEQGNQLGLVTFTNSPDQAPPGTAVADVAFIDLASGYRQDGQPHSNTVGQASLRDDITAFGAASRTARTSWVFAICSEFAGEHPQHGDWGEVGVTRDAISDPGDSGGPVLANHTQEVVGHIVGGYAGVYSLVQDLDYQLRAFGGRLR